MKLKSIVALILIALCVSLATLSVGAADVPSVAVGDLNGDGYINTTDVVVLRRFIAGGYDVELVPPTMGCNHEIVIDSAVAPTCTVTGLTEGKHCAKCGDVLVKQEVVPAAGHKLVNGVCSVCGLGSYPELEVVANVAIEEFYLAVPFSGDNGSDLYEKLIDRIKEPAYIPSARDVEDAFDEVTDSFADKADELSEKSYAAAEAGKIAIWEQFAMSYLEAANEFIAVFKEYAKEVYLENYYDDVDALQDTYEGVEDEKMLAAYRQKLAALKEKLDFFNANIDAIPIYTYEQVFDLELAKKFDPAYDKSYTVEDLKAYVSADGVSDKYTKYIVYLIGGTINEHLSDSPNNGQSGMLGDVSFMLQEDLFQFRERLDPTSDDADIYSTTLRGNEIVYIDGGDYKFGRYYSNTAKFEEMVDMVDEAISAIQMLRAEDFEDTEITLLTPDSTLFGSNNRKKSIYWVNEQAKEWFYDNGYDFNWLINMETGSATADKGLTITNTNLTADLITMNNTGIPVTVTRTAEQQAVLAAQNIYADAFNKVHQMIITLDTTNYAVQACKKITGTSEFKAIKNAVKSNPALMAEVDAYAAVYTNKINTLAADKKYGFVGNSFKTMVTTNNMIDRAASGKEFIINGAELVNAENYSHENVLNQLYTYVDKFNQTFYMDEAGKESAVVVLYDYKNYAVTYITEVINSYKNRYETVVLNGVTHINQIPGVIYAYDLGLQGASAQGLAFEASLDEMLADYTAKIMAVTLNSRIDIKNNFGLKIYSKVGDFAWSFTTARRAINAYIVDLLGYQMAGEFADGVSNLYSDTNYTAPDGIVYGTGDSRVFNAFKTLYWQDYSAYTPVR